MLKFTRKEGERFYVGESLVTIIKTSPSGVTIGVAAEPGVIIDREEVHERKLADARAETKRIAS